MFGFSLPARSRAVGAFLVWLSVILAIHISLCFSTLPALAAVEWAGDISPNDPTKWTSSTDAYIGRFSQGILNITSGSTIIDKTVYIGGDSTSTGEVNIDGIGSTWTNNGYLYIGNSGSGFMNISGGGAVSNGDGHIGDKPESTGEVNVNGTASTWTNNGSLDIGRYGSGVLEIANGGTVIATSNTWVDRNPESSGAILFDNGILSTGGLCCKADNLIGTGTINTHGLVSDVGLIFNATYGLNQILNIARIPGQSITVNLTVDGSGPIGAGYGGIGTMSISDRRIIESSGGYIGYKAGSVGIVTVDGVGSTWTDSFRLWVGNFGSATLNITDGGMVKSKDSSVGREFGSTGQITVSGVGSMWENSGEFSIGDRGNGSLCITNGGGVVNKENSFIGSGAGSTGEVTVAGNSSTLTMNEDLYIGRYGHGILKITGDGTVTVKGDTLVSLYADSLGVIHFDNGTLSTDNLFCALKDITGVGTINTHGLISDTELVFNATYGLNQILNIANNPGQNITVNLTVDASNPMGAGYGNTGSISISEGRDVESTGGYIGYKSGSTGNVTVDGTGSTWTNNDGLYVGLYGSGTMKIINSGTIKSDISFIGSKSGSMGNVTVNGTGSTWIINDESLVIGHYGEGMLNITNSGMVSDSWGFIGNYSGSKGEVTVNGAGSTWVTHNNLYVGNYGSGTLSITNGGTVSSGFGYIGYFSGSTGNVTVDGTDSRWMTSNDLYVGSRYGSGALNIMNGGAVISRNSYISGGRQSTAEATVRGAGSMWLNSESFRVGGNYSGTLNIIEGGLVSVAGTLTTIVDGYGFINISNGGMLALRGNADDSIINYLGLVNGSDDIRYWDDSISDWADIVGATYGEDYTLGYLVGGWLDGYTVLCVGAPEPGTVGDANNDGEVNETDAAMLAAFWQTASGATWGMGDFNGDGAVNDIDATLLAANWTGSGSAGSGYVPEPSGVVGLLGLGLAGMLSVLRARRKESR